MKCDKCNQEMEPVDAKKGDGFNEVRYASNVNYDLWSVQMWCKACDTTTDTTMTIEEFEDMCMKIKESKQ